MTDQDILAALRTRDPIAVLALTLFGECRNQSAAGKLAVAWVILTRSRRRRQTIQDVCLAPMQFSCWFRDPSTTNDETVLATAARLLNNDPITEPGWQECLDLAADVVCGRTTDPTFGADHYLTTDLYMSNACPTWAHLMTRTATIGAHTFLRSA